MEQYINGLKVRFKSIIYNHARSNKANKVYIQIWDEGNRKEYPVRIKEINKGKQLRQGKEFLKI